MGYLAVMGISFLVTLVGSAVAMAVLSVNFFGSVQEWVLAGAVFLAFWASACACDYYAKAHP